MTKMPFPPLEISSWPVQDRVRWLAARKSKKLFAERTAADWRPATARNVERGYGIYLGWLAAKGLLNPAAPMEQRVKQECIERLAEEYAVGRAPLTVAGMMRDIAMMLRACVPPDGIPWLTRLGFRLVNEAEPEQSKLPHMASPDELLALGEQLMDGGRRGWEDRHRAGGQMYRDGLMIASLAVRPMLRLRAFVALRLGHTLFRESGCWLMDIPPVSSKTKRRQRQAFPAFLTPAIDFYVENIRKGLPDRPLEHDDGWMWLGRKGPLKPGRVTAIISGCTFEHLGRSISPHRFRDSAATAIALHIPQQIGITKSILGHATLRSSQEHYNQARSYSASAELAGVIEKLRREP